MVDNFEKIEKLLKFDKKGDCYYVQLLRRQSDDPMIDGKPDPAYHGNMHSRSLKDYFIVSVDHLRDLKKEMITLCDVFNVRAYIRLNKRNFENIDIKMAKHVMDEVDSGKTYSSPFHIVSSAAGSVSQAGKSKTWILDLDAEYLPYEETILKFVAECEPHATLIHNMGMKWHEAGCDDVESMEKAYAEWRANIVIIPTKSGHHVIAKPFNKKTFGDKWQQYCLENNITAPLPQVKFDPAKGEVHWSLTDKYLKHAVMFAAVLQKCGTTTRIDKIDKNKTIVHSGQCDQQALEKAWHDYCLEKQFWMKAPDMHKDNPTILYVP